jgi:regulator of protease activity HflC (stomatin/prohibitin superfamily)
MLLTCLGIVLIALALLGTGIALAASGDKAVGIVLIVLGPLLLIAGIIALNGLTSILPGEARVVQLFGRYVGTARAAGLRWFNPLTRRRRVSTRIRNHETAVTKVNDADGNPIEIAAVVVWQVEDTARAVYEVDDFVAFVDIQTETAVRHIATSYPYDSASNDRLSLRDNAEEITVKLSAEIAARVESAGVRIVESRLTRLAYAPEIAQTMLRRQQAAAVVAARQQIVAGAVGMVEMALNRLDEENVVELDEERKAAMVSNLLVVLCSDHATQPVVNTGSLYH